MDSGGEGNIFFQFPVGFIMIGFFGLWNSIMSMMMIQNVFVPMSNGVCGCGQVILLLFPHWYIGFIVPTIFGGIIPGVIVILIPYGVGTCLAWKKDMWGCQYQMQEANNEEYEKAEDKEGNKVKIGDKAVNTYRVSGGKHRASYDAERDVTLTWMSHNGNWKCTYEAEEGQMCSSGGMIMVKGKSFELKGAKKNAIVEASNHMQMVPANMNGGQMQMMPMQQQQPMMMSNQVQPGMMVQQQPAMMTAPGQPMMMQQPGMQMQPQMMQPGQQQMPGQPMMMQPGMMQMPVGQPGEATIDPVTGKPMINDPNVAHGMPVMQQ